MANTLTNSLRTETFSQVLKDQELISEGISSLFGTALTSSLLPFSVLEERLCFSEPFRALERGNDLAFKSSTHSSLFGAIFGVNEAALIPLPPSDSSLWAGKMFAKLFFRYHLSFSTLFLLISISEMNDLYAPYHEMDESAFFGYFEDRQNQTNIFSALLKRRGLNVPKLSAITGIKVWTLVSYQRDQETLFHASIANVYALSRALKVPMECFVASLW